MGACHLIQISSLSLNDIEFLFKRAFEFKKKGKASFSSLLQGRELGILFYEPSTRTKLSFELAATRLGAKVLSLDLASSSLQKGESFEETAKTLEALGFDGLVIRSQEHQVVKEIAHFMQIPVINAGTGIQQHPTQALLDAFTLQEVLSGNLKGLKVIFMGDFQHSRVFRSTASLLDTLGCEVGVYSEKERDRGKSKWRFLENLEEVLAWSPDVFYLLRNQKERWQGDKQEKMKNDCWIGLKEFLAGGDSWLMHPGPLDKDQRFILDLPNCLVNQQVENGVWIRMAVLEFCLRGRNE